MARRVSRKNLKTVYDKIVSGIGAMEARDIVTTGIELERLQRYQAAAIGLAKESIRDAMSFADLGLEPEVAATTNADLGRVLATFEALKPMKVDATEFFIYLGATRSGATVEATNEGREEARKAPRQLAVLNAEIDDPEGDVVNALLAATQAADGEIPLSVRALSKFLLSVGIGEKTANVQSLNTRLERMRARGFRQRTAEKGRPRRRRQADGSDQFQRLPPGLALIFGTQTGTHLLRLILKDLRPSP